MVTVSKARGVRFSNSMTLHDLLLRYQAALEVGDGYVGNLRRTVKKCEDSGMLEVCQLSPDPVNLMLSRLPLSATTRANIRRELMTLWRFAYESGLTETYPARVRKIRQAAAPVECWTAADLSRLLKAAREDETPISSRVQARRCDVLPAWIGVGYDTALRFGDVHALTAANIRNGCVVTTAHKTGKPVVRAISEDTQEAVRHLLELSPDRSLFKWCLPRRRAFVLWRKFLDQHGMTGSSKWLRRAAATQAEMQARGRACELLQHSQPSLAYRHYVDVTQFAAPPAPPPIRSA